MRVSWKLPMVIKNFKKNNIFNEISWLKFFIKNPHIRNLTISKTLVGEIVYTNNGKLSVACVITSKMKGHKIGEFAKTKTLGKEYHIAREKKKKKKR